MMRDSAARWLLAISKEVFNDQSRTDSRHMSTRIQITIYYNRKLETKLFAYVYPDFWALLRKAIAICHIRWRGITLSAVQAKTIEFIHVIVHKMRILLSWRLGNRECLDASENFVIPVSSRARWGSKDHPKYRLNTLFIEARALRNPSSSAPELINEMIQGVPPTREYRAMGMELNNVPGIAIETRPGEVRQYERQSL
jgi:hypothetical protein